MNVLRHIMAYLDRHLHQYKVQLTQPLKPADHSQRRRYVEWVLKQQVLDGNFSNKIFFSIEAHFTLGAYVNKQNCGIWSSEDPQVIEEGPLHPTRVTVWCALWSEDVIGPYFFGIDDGTTATVNLEHNGHMITDFFFACY